MRVSIKGLRLESDLSARAARLLGENGIRYLDELADRCSYADVLVWEDCGPKIALEIRQVLACHRLTLKGDRILPDGRVGLIDDPKARPKLGTIPFDHYRIHLMYTRERMRQADIAEREGVSVNRIYQVCRKVRERLEAGWSVET